MSQANTGSARSQIRIWDLRARTALWTGNVEGKNSQLIGTGLLGSIRWWFEVLVRGLGGQACDPTQADCKGRDHCVVCELFGCTGWARKFRFDVLDENGSPQRDQIQGENRFQLRFTPLRPVQEEEWLLLDRTLQLIADYGALGGKTVFKPTEEGDRSGKLHHRDFGLVSLESRPSLPKPPDLQAMQAYVRQARWRGPGHNGPAWASLRNMWVVPGRCLARQNPRKSTFNAVLGRNEDKNANPGEGGDPFRAGRKAKNGHEPESKKVFSFKNPEPGGRTFGFVPDGQGFEEILADLQGKAWPDLGEDELLRGDQILDQLLNNKTTEGK